MLCFLTSAPQSLRIVFAMATCMNIDRKLLVNFTAFIVNVTGRLVITIYENTHTKLSLQYLKKNIFFRFFFSFYIQHKSSHSIVEYDQLNLNPFVKLIMSH